VAVGGELALEEAVGVEMEVVGRAIGDREEVVDGVDGIRGGGVSVGKVRYWQKLGFERGEISAYKGVLGGQVGKVY
jgi:hypothetical protein